MGNGSVGPLVSILVDSASAYRWTRTHAPAFVTSFVMSEFRRWSYTFSHDWWEKLKIQRPAWQLCATLPGGRLSVSNATLHSTRTGRARCPEVKNYPRPYFDSAACLWCAYENNHFGT